MSILLSSNSPYGNCTVTICHSHTKNMKELCREADIIVAALGKPEFVTEDMVKEGAVIIDVGITRVPDASKKSGFSLKGDVHFASVAPKCSYITPVPRGVGPMTIAALMKNTLKPVQRTTKIREIKRAELGKFLMVSIFKKYSMLNIQYSATETLWVILLPYSLR